MNHVPNTQVTLAGDTLHVTTWSTSDRTVLAGAQAASARGDELATWFAHLVTAGAAAVTAAGAGTDLARIDQALDRLDRELQRSLQQVVDRLHASVAKATDPTTGDVAVAAQAAVDRLAEGVQRVLTGSDALLPEASARAVNQVTASALSEIHRLLDTDRRQLGSLIAADRERSAVDSRGRSASRTATSPRSLASFERCWRTPPWRPLRRRAGPARGSCTRPPSRRPCTPSQQPPETVERMVWAAALAPTGHVMETSSWTCAACPCDPASSSSARTVLVPWCHSGSGRQPWSKRSTLATPRWPSGSVHGIRCPARTRRCWCSTVAAWWWPGTTPTATSCSGPSTSWVASRQLSSARMRPAPLPSSKLMFER